MKIESEDIDIDRLLTGRSFFIPRFQRPYSWDDENVNEFWNDLANSGEQNYFIGSMVVFRRSKAEYGVVDGQQRLTTITILLACIRDALAALGESDLASGLHQLIERKDRDNRAEFVLKTESSFPYFQEYIQKFGQPDLDVAAAAEESRLKRTQEIFRARISESVDTVDQDSLVPDDEKLAAKRRRLVQLRDSVLNLNLIFVVLDDEDDAYLIFETLNTRGKDLGVTDLVKNLFTKHLRGAGPVDAVKLKWDRMLDAIHNSSAEMSSDTFIQHFWASREESATVKRLFPVMKKRITASTAAEYLNELVADSELYRSIHEPAYGWTKNETAVARSLAAMQLFKLAQPMPTTLSLVRAYRSKVISYRQLTRAMAAIENFHFAFTAVTSSRSSGGMTAMYSGTARKIYKARNSQEAAAEIQSLLTNLRERRPSFDEFAIDFREITFTNANSKQRQLVRYILRKFSEHYGYKYSVDFEELTIEHIAPQALIGRPGWDDHSVGSLGNLMFLDPAANGLVGDDDHAKKIEALTRSGHSIPDQVLESRHWTPESIAAHGEQLARVAYGSVWKV